MTYYRLKITFLLLAFEDVDALRILQRQTIRTQIVDGKGILVKQELTIQDLPCSPRVGFRLHIVLHLATFQDIEVLVYRSLLAEERSNIDNFLCKHLAILRLVADEGDAVACQESALHDARLLIVDEDGEGITCI